MRRFYDRKCESCGWLKIDSLETTDEKMLCPDCGEPAVRVWLSKAPDVIQDTIDHWQINGTKHPIHFDSEQGRRRWMKENGLREFVRHKGEDGTDKSRHTMRWATMDQYTLDNARELLERAAKAPARNEPREEPLNVITYSGIGTPSRSDFERGRR